jgi:hypothetical protein
MSNTLCAFRWASSYDFRLNSTTNEKKETSCQLVYYGSVENDSGEDWKDVQLSLSTATPSSAAKPPALKTLYASAQGAYYPNKQTRRNRGWFLGKNSSMARPEYEMNILQADMTMAEDEDEGVNIELPTTSVGKTCL